MLARRMLSDPSQTITTVCLLRLRPAQAARRMEIAEQSGATAVLSLLRESIASKSIRVTELFNAMDTSKDGLISR